MPWRVIRLVIPPAVTRQNHDAFGYYLDRYGLEFVGSVIPSFDSSAELSGRDVRDLVAKIRATGSRRSSPRPPCPRAAETIGREAGVKVVVDEDAVYGDALGPPGSDGDTYLKMLRHTRPRSWATSAAPETTWPAADLSAGVATAG